MLKATTPKAVVTVTALLEAAMATSSPGEGPLAPPLAPPAGRPPRSLLLFHAIVKRQNIGAMLRSAAAFGVSEALASGAAGHSVFGAKGAERHVPVRNFERFADAAAWLRAQGVALCGIEIAEGARDVATRPFTGDTCFLAGNEGEGLTEALKAACDQLVYVRQTGNGTASLNVAAATAICLHHFAEWARMPERPREAGRDKFAVDPAPLFFAATSDVVARKREERRRLREGGGEEGGGAALGGDSSDGGGAYVEEASEGKGGGGPGGGPGGAEVADCADGAPAALVASPGSAVGGEAASAASVAASLLREKRLRFELLVGVAGAAELVRAQLDELLALATRASELAGRGAAAPV